MINFTFQVTLFCKLQISRNTEVSLYCKFPRTRKFHFTASFPEHGSFTLLQVSQNTEVSLYCKFPRTRKFHFTASFPEHGSFTLLQVSRGTEVSLYCKFPGARKFFLHSPRTWQSGLVFPGHQKAVNGCEDGVAFVSCSGSSISRVERWGLGAAGGYSDYSKG